MRTGDQIVQDLPWRWNVQGRIFIIGGLGYMFDAWDVTLNGFLTPLIGTQFDLSPFERTWVTTANLLGMAIGAVAWGAIADRMGRKTAFSVTLGIFALFSALAALAPSYELFLALRFLAGVGLGGCIPVDYAIVSEFSPRKLRGRILTALDIWWPVGASLCGIAAVLLLNVENNWRWMSALMAIPALLLFWIRRGVPESPVYLARRGREEEARAVIDDLVRRTGATPEPYVVDAQDKQTSGPRGVAAAWDQLRAVWSYDKGLTAAAWMLFVSIMVVYYAALSWMPTILASNGFTTYASFVSTTLMSLVGIAGVLVSAWLVEIVGRKWLIGIVAPVAAGALVAFAWVLEFPTPALIFIGAFGLLIQVTIPVLYAYASEIYPTRLRASGFGWASGVSRLVTAVSPMIFGAFLWPVLGLPLTFGLLTVFVIVAVIAMTLWAPETKGRPLDVDDDDDEDLDQSTAVAQAKAADQNATGAE